MQNWYVIHVLSGQEKKIKRILEENASARGVSELIHEVMLPVENVSEVKKGEQKITEKKLWPGYLLIKITFTDESWQYVKDSEGVINFLGDGKPSPLSDVEVEEILDELKSKKETVTHKHRFEKDDLIKIVDGVFENFNASVLEVFHEKGTMSVMVSIFGRDTQVDDLEFWQVEEVKDGAEA